MFTGCDVCIAVGGDYESIEVPRNRGMKFEKALAQKDHIPYIPVPFVSGFSEECYRDLEETSFEAFENTRVKELLCYLSAEADPLLAASITIALALYACIS
jgi:hypothetical protein